MSDFDKEYAKVQQAVNRGTQEFSNKLLCAGCGRKPEQIAEYRWAAIAEYLAEIQVAEDADTQIWEDLTEAEQTEDIRDYVATEEGTLNIHTGAFLCTECYIIAGTPTSQRPEGWTVPKGAEWPLAKKQFAARAASRGYSVPYAPDTE